MENAIDQLIVWSKDLKVLYVEDDISLREEVSIFLGDIFQSVDLATNGQEGLDKLAIGKYDIVITDIRMPVMDGIEMIEKIKTLYPSQAILVTSAHNEVEHLVKLISLGISNFITKPLQSEQIFKVLHKIVEHINQKKELRRYEEELERSNEKLKKLTLLQSKSIDLKTSILNAYKEALDKAAIVSITGLDGIIKDVNENFCKATGYTKEEIVGKKHNLISHPSTCREIYKDLWETILAKKIWQGFLVNQSKTLSPLYHYTTIVPILDNQNNIIEFIGIIQDLTQLHQENEEQAKLNIDQAMVLKDSDLLKSIPFPSGFIRNDLTFSSCNKLLEEIVIAHTQEELFGKLTSKKLHLKELIYFEEMDYFETIEGMKGISPYEGDITFKGVIKSLGGILEVLVRISKYSKDLSMICIVKQEDFELCCQVQEK